MCCAAHVKGGGGGKKVGDDRIKSNKVTKIGSIQRKNLVGDKDETENSKQTKNVNSAIKLRTTGKVTKTTAAAALKAFQPLSFSLLQSRRRTLRREDRTV